MILSLCAMIALSQNPVPDAKFARPASPGKLLTEVFQRYADAKTMMGHIKLSQSARGVTIYVETDVAFSLPSLLRVRQVKGGSDPRQWLMISDGANFTYDRADSTFGSPRPTEPVEQKAGRQEVKGMYGTGAVALADRSAPLDIAFARNVDLREVLSHWGNMAFGKRMKVRDIDVNVIEGDYMEVPGADPTGTFALAISDQGDILQYVVKNRYAVPSQPQEKIEVTSLWDVDLKVDVEVDPKVFKP